MRRLYLPSLATAPTGATPPPPEPKPPEPKPPEPKPEPPGSEFGNALYWLMHDDPGQQREKVVPYHLLELAAQFRTDDMVQRDYFAHTDPDGYGPNYHVRRFGYALPGWYGSALDANNVESIAYGASNAAHVWQLFLGSPAHRAHVLGLTPFWASQVYVGIGATALPNGRYVVCILSAPAEE